MHFDSCWEKLKGHRANKYQLSTSHLTPYTEISEEELISETLFSASIHCLFLLSDICGLMPPLTPQ